MEKGGFAQRINRLREAKCHPMGPGTHRRHRITLYVHYMGLYNCSGFSALFIPVCCEPV